MRVGEGNFPRNQRMSEEEVKEDLYKIIRGEDIGDLHKAVNVAKYEGWRTVGGLCYVPPAPLELAQMASGKKVSPFHQAVERDPLPVEESKE